MQTFLPNINNSKCNFLKFTPLKKATSFSSTVNTSSNSLAIPKRLATLDTCVSTAKAGSSKSSERVTFAVLWPTPGRLSKNARSFGTLPS